MSPSPHFYQEVPRHCDGPTIPTPSFPILFSFPLILSHLFPLQKPPGNPLRKSEKCCKLNVDFFSFQLNVHEGLSHWERPHDKAFVLMEIMPRLCMLHWQWHSIVFAGYCIIQRFKLSWDRYYCIVLTHQHVNCAKQSNWSRSGFDLSQKQWWVLPLPFGARAVSPVILQLSCLFKAWWLIGCGWGSVIQSIGVWDFDCHTIKSRVQ